MEIEDMGELTEFETMPTEGTLYLTAVHYPNWWTCGPSGADKDTVINDLRTWGGIDKARIYAVRVPLDSHGG